MHIKCINLTNNTISVIFYSVSFVNVALENEQQITFFSGLSVGHSPIQQVAVADTTPPTADMLAGDAHGRPWTPAAFLSTHIITGTVLLLWRAHESFCLIIRTLWPHMTEIAGQQISCIKLKTKKYLNPVPYHSCALLHCFQFVCADSLIWTASASSCLQRNRGGGCSWSPRHHHWSPSANAGRDDPGAVCSKLQNWRCHCIYKRGKDRNTV